MHFTSTILAVFALSLACTHEKAEEPSKYREGELSAKKAFYCEQGKSQYETRRYMVARCDGLLFTSLWSIACGSGNVDAFQDPAKRGYWHRNSDRDCFLAGKDNGSKSSISKDMILGLLYHSWKTANKDHIDGLVEYGEENGWVMGDAIDAKTRISRTLLSPGLIDLLYDIQGRLRLQAPGQQSDDAFFVNKGFQAHLDVIRILLEGSVKGSITSIQASVLKAQADREPSNALYVAAAARYGQVGAEKATDLLLDNPHFPSARLPSKAEHCEDYLFQRDEGDDWQPCGTDAELHDGTDFVVAASILDGSL